MNKQEFEAIIGAYRRGVEDGFHRGNYRNPYVDGWVYSAYKRGYDAGISMYCEAEGLDREEQEGVEA